MHNLVEAVANYIGLDIEQVNSMALAAPTSYRRYLIPKKRGGQRAIYHPAKTTKALQYALTDMFLSALAVHTAAAAYVPGIKSPIKQNAAIHAPFAYTVRVDMADFFPSIGPEALFHIVKSGPVTTFRNLSKDEKKFLANALFVRLSGTHKLGLAIGAPSSPAISNVVMYFVDEKMTEFSRKREGVYSRYADDFVFSSNKKGDCTSFVRKLTDLLSRVKEPKLKINEEKTIFSSRGTKRVVTGLVITPENELSVGRHNKRYIRKLLWDLKQNVLEEKEHRFLQGYLAYVLDVEPRFFNQLVLKYGGELVRRGLDHKRQ